MIKYFQFFVLISCWHYSFAEAQSSLDLDNLNRFHLGVLKNLKVIHGHDLNEIHREYDQRISAEATTLINAKFESAQQRTKEVKIKRVVDRWNGYQRFYLNPPDDFPVFGTQSELSSTCFNAIPLCPQITLNDCLWESHQKLLRNPLAASIVKKEVLPTDLLIKSAKELEVQKNNLGDQHDLLTRIRSSEHDRNTKEANVRHWDYFKKRFNEFLVSVGALEPQTKKEAFVEEKIEKDPVFYGDAFAVFAKTKCYLQTIAMYKTASKARTLKVDAEYHRLLNRANTAEKQCKETYPFTTWNDQNLSDKMFAAIVTSHNSSDEDHEEFKNEMSRLVSIYETGALSRMNSMP